MLGYVKILAEECNCVSRVWESEQCKGRVTLSRKLFCGVSCVLLSWNPVQFIMA